MENRDTAHGCFLKDGKRWCSLAQKCYNPRRERCVSNGDSTYDVDKPEYRGASFSWNQSKDTGYSWHQTSNGRSSSPPAPRYIPRPPRVRPPAPPSRRGGIFDFIPRLLPGRDYLQKPQRSRFVQLNRCTHLDCKYG